MERVWRENKYPNIPLLICGGVYLGVLSMYLPFPELWMAFIAFFNFVRPSRSKSNVWNKKYKVKIRQTINLELIKYITSGARLRQWLWKDFLTRASCHWQKDLFTIGATSHSTRFRSTSNICRPSRRLINGPPELSNRPIPK